MRFLFLKQQQDGTDAGPVTSKSIVDAALLVSTSGGGPQQLPLCSLVDRSTSEVVSDPASRYGG
jgi:hypothetical protein